MSNFKEAVDNTVSLIRDLPNSWQRYDEGTMSRSELRDHDYLILDGIKLQVEHVLNTSRAIPEIDKKNLIKDPR